MRSPAPAYWRSITRSPGGTTTKVMPDAATSGARNGWLFRRPQRLQGDCNSLAIGGAELTRVGDDLNHRATDTVGIRRHAAVEHFDEILDLPVMQLALREVGHAARPGRPLAAGEAPARDDRAEKIARRMTFGAMAGCVHQIGASVPLRGLRGVGPERRIVKKQQ